MSLGLLAVRQFGLVLYFRPFDNHYGPFLSSLKLDYVNIHITAISTATFDGKPSKTWFSAARQGLTCLLCYSTVPDACII